jgi:hypothetical protein
MPAAQPNDAGPPIPSLALPWPFNQPEPPNAKLPAQVLIVGAITVACLSPLNIVFYALCWTFLATAFGPKYADNVGSFYVFWVPMVSVALYALLAVPVYFLYRRRPINVQCRSLVILTVGFLALSFILLLT